MPKTPWMRGKRDTTVALMINTANLTHNLQQLANIKTGEKIRVENGRIIVTGGGKWAGLFHRNDEDSIQATGGESGVWGHFFASTCQQLMDGVAGVTRQALGDALEGLRRLRAAYSGRTDALRLIDALLQHSEKAYRQAVAVDQRNGLYRRWGERVRPFDQSSYLPDESAGACYGFCYDWARRIVFRNKVSYFQSKKVIAPPDADRFRKKVAGRVLTVQSNYEERRYDVRNPIRDPKKKCGPLWFDPSRPILTAAFRTAPTVAEKQAASRELFDACVESVRAAGDRQTGCFLVCLKGENDGHVVAVYYTAEHGGRYAIFDPNVGEAHFNAIDRRQLEELWLDMLALQDTDVPTTSIVLQPLVLHPA